LLVSLDDEAARSLRGAGFRVSRAVNVDEAAAEREAREGGAAYLITPQGLKFLGDRGNESEETAARLRAALAGST